MEQRWIHTEFKHGYKPAAHAVYHTALMDPVERRPQVITIRVGPDDVVEQPGLRWSTFFAACVVSALLTVVAALFLGAHSEPNIILSKIINNLEFDGAGEARGHSAYLSMLFSEQAKDLKGQIAIITQVVDTYSDHPEPKKLALSIVSESFRAGYDPLFVAAVIKTESTFKQRAISDRGARGLMQIMPATEKYISKMANIPWEGERRLHDTDYNLRVGIAYLKYLDKMFKGNREKILIAYNWGPGNLEDALKNGTQIPSCTKDYARKVISNYQKWRADLRNNKNSFVA